MYEALIVPVAGTLIGKAHRGSFDNSITPVPG